MDSNETYIIEECSHCGNKTKLDIVGRYHEVSNEYTDIQYCIDWLLLRCCVCEQISLGSVYYGEDTQYPDYQGNIECVEIYKTRYPIETYQGTNVPDSVNNAFIAALKVRYVDNMNCLLALRRTLEVICKDNGATKGKLEKKILYLTEKGIFPNVINDASDILRILGNEAAHGDSVEYDEHVVNELITFTQAIIEYVYVIPYRIQRIRTKLGKPPKATHQ